MTAHLAMSPAQMVLAPMPTDGASIVKHSLVVAGHRTSISLEDAFWTVLRGVATDRGLSIAALVAEIDAARGKANLSSAIRVAMLATTIGSPSRDVAQ